MGVACSAKSFHVRVVQERKPHRREADLVQRHRHTVVAARDPLDAVAAVHRDLAVVEPPHDLGEHAFADTELSP